MPDACWRTCTIVWAPRGCRERSPARLGSGDLARLPAGVAGVLARGVQLAAPEERLNQLDHFTEDIDGQRIHFVYQRSGLPGALPVLLAHGWPGSIVEFLDVVGPLTARGPGGAVRPDHPLAARLWLLRADYRAGLAPAPHRGRLYRLLRRLGVERYGVQGGDWGSMVATNMADLAPDRVAALHLNFLAAPRPEGLRPASLPPEDQARIQAMRQWQTEETGYSAIQGTRPQTIGYALENWPAGLAAWIVEKFRAWSDCGGDIERSFTKDQLLTNITVTG